MLTRHNREATACREAWPPRLTIRLALPTFLPLRHAGLPGFRTRQLVADLITFALPFCAGHADTLALLLMTMALAAADDPFKDPSLHNSPAPPPNAPQTTVDVPDTLVVSRNASLTLGTDSLVVLGTFCI